VTPELVEWAEIVFVMEEAHRAKLSARFRNHLRNSRVVCLGIPDVYDFMDPNLIRLLEARVSRYLPNVFGTALDRKAALIKAPTD
jgi:predicted protein tyrosine phosphatase